MEDYNLAPRDAIIALTCKHHKISITATFDKDFQRVPWLKAIPKNQWITVISKHFKGA